VLQLAILNGSSRQVIGSKDSAPSVLRLVQVRARLVHSTTCELAEAEGWYFVEGDSCLLYDQVDLLQLVSSHVDRGSWRQGYELGAAGE